MLCKIVRIEVKIEVVRKIMNLAETLQYLEDLDVSDSSENDLEIEHQDITKIFIQPPLVSNGNNSDIDSGDEEDGNIDNLSRNQLLAPASLVVKDVRKGKIHAEQNIDQEEKEDYPASNCSGSGSNKRKTSIKVKNGGSKRNSCEPLAT